MATTHATIAFASKQPRKVHHGIQAQATLSLAKALRPKETNVD
jgi:hypothetical protein